MPCEIERFACLARGERSDHPETAPLAHDDFGVVDAVAVVVHVAVAHGPFMRPRLAGIAKRRRETFVGVWNGPLSTGRDPVRVQFVKPAVP